ncbi:hypothetical protein LG325_11980 [Marinobacter nauticus]
MKSINRAHLFPTLLLLGLFSPLSKAVIITSYTGLFDDGSKLVVDLKGYDYEEGSHFASPSSWPEDPSIEEFDTFFYPSWSLQQQFGFEAGKIGQSFPERGLYFSVDQNHSASMTDFAYLFQLPDWSIESSGIHVQYHDHHVGFSGGFFETYPPSFKVDEPGNVALMIIGFAGLAWARKRRNTVQAA